MSLAVTNRVDKLQQILPIFISIDNLKPFAISFQIYKGPLNIPIHRKGKTPPSRRRCQDKTQKSFHDPVA
jgi:hypothetical protein